MKRRRVKNFAGTLLAATTTTPIPLTRAHKTIIMITGWRWVSILFYYYNTYIYIYCDISNSNIVVATAVAVQRVVQWPRMGFAHPGDGINYLSRPLLYQRMAY